MPSTCVIVGLIVASATSTTVHWTKTAQETMNAYNLYQEVATLARRDKDDVQVLRLPGAPSTARPIRCGFETLYATLTGGV